MLFAALTHTLTHTGKRTGGTHGTKSFRPHPFCGKNARKPLYTNGWRAFYHLRSAVRIRPVAPKDLFSIENRSFSLPIFPLCVRVWSKVAAYPHPCGKYALPYRTNSTCYTVIIFSHSIYSRANSDSTREGLQIYPISICPRSVMGTLTKERRRSSCVR